MTYDIILFNPETNNIFLETTTAFLSLNQYSIIETENQLPEILFVTSFPPRECGIATYSQDLIIALKNQFEDSFTCSICAIESNNEQHNYVHQPKYILNTDDIDSFSKNAHFINHNENIKLVVIQHEFGFFAHKEKEFKQFLDSINQPIVFVFHTVLPNPEISFKIQVQEITNIVSSIIVMTKDAAKILENHYYVPSYKITIIPHGTHLVPPLNRDKVKAFYQLSNRLILSTFGLLSSSKSIETTLNALPTIIKKFPNVLFLILGKTHPTIVKNEGEIYRNMLEEKVKLLGLENNVRFINEYLQLGSLLEYLQLTDIYLFTSKDPKQAVSGTFSYALSCGCPVISTPIPHAKEVLNNKNGIIINFENSVQLASTVISLLENEKLRTEISNHCFNKMASTAWQNSAISHSILFEKLVTGSFHLNYRIPKINLSHLKKMTTRFGIIQFAKIANPDTTSGYTLDDNARALVALCEHYKLYKNEKDLGLIHTYLQFIKYCLQPNNTLLNYVNEDKVFTEQNSKENIEDSTGRAIWALGYVISLNTVLPVNLINEAQHLLDRTLEHVHKIFSTRAMAFIIKGLHYQNKQENIHILDMFAKRLTKMYHHEKTSDWRWFESYLTYGNSLLPEAMLCAFECTNNIEYKNIAKETFDFLLSKTIKNGKIKVISNNGWFFKNKHINTTSGGEQPIDVAYTVLALEKFYTVFKNDEYKQKAILSFSWFLGNNHLHQIVYNPCTGGCYDGVEEHNINLNQGAESTISYLMARLAMERLMVKKQEVEYIEY
ncbi:MAG: glycosyltransferase [Bacteroidia bacterium]|jgi:glycosyltransferase involved in cell wall biosynthesis|nr:glycosyltransferase [Bacteroidia bacterium]